MNRLAVLFTILLAGTFLPSAVLVTQTSLYSMDLVITQARVIDSTGTIHEGTTLAITKERIQTIHPGPIQLKTTLTIDAGGKTMLPGLINFHVPLRPPGVA